MNYEEKTEMNIILKCLCEFPIAAISEMNVHLSECRLNKCYYVIGMGYDRWQLSDRSFMSPTSPSPNSSPLSP